MGSCVDFNLQVKQIKVEAGISADVEAWAVFKDQVMDAEVRASFDV